MALALAARQVEKRYGQAQALRGVSLEVRAAELVGLLGPNGAGKSTLTKIACGLVRPTVGEVEVGGQPAGSAPARASLGYLAELFRFPGWMTADELLLLHQRLARSEGGTTERGELLDLVGLADAARTRVEAMSKGMQQRLGIAQALVGRPRGVEIETDGGTRVYEGAGREDVPRIVADLVAAGERVYGARLLASTLEEVYLEAVGGRTG